MLFLKLIIQIKKKSQLKLIFELLKIEVAEIVTSTLLKEINF
jgi:hypothetical protein